MNAATVTLCMEPAATLGSAAVDSHNNVRLAPSTEYETQSISVMLLHDHVNHDVPLIKLMFTSTAGSSATQPSTAHDTLLTAPSTPLRDVPRTSIV